MIQLLLCHLHLLENILFDKSPNMETKIILTYYKEKLNLKLKLIHSYSGKL